MTKLVNKTPRGKFFARVFLLIFYPHQPRVDMLGKKGENANPFQFSRDFHVEINIRDIIIVYDTCCHDSGMTFILIKYFSVYNLSVKLNQQLECQVATVESDRNKCCLKSFPAFLPKLELFSIYGFTFLMEMAT